MVKETKTFRMDAPLAQTRQLMASNLPEYRPFALQEVLRAAKLGGGGAANPSGDGAVKPSGPLSRVPAWLDIFLYVSVALVVGTAFFMGLYHMYVKPCAPDDDDDIQPHDSARRARYGRAGAPRDPLSPGAPRGDVFPLHPQPPPPPPTM